MSINAEDLLFGLIIFVIVALVLLGVFGISYRHHAFHQDITENYNLPPGLAGCRVYSLSPAGLGRTLYIVTRDGRPVETSWDEHDGKTSRRISVQPPEGQ